MKKIFCFAMPLLFGCFTIKAQYDLFAKISDNYFRANPFDREYSKFVNLLMNDPIIANKAIVKRTDTTFFSFMAEYKNYSPYTFIADRTEIKLMEQEVEVSDSISVIDTVFIYQLLGYKYGKDGLEAVKKEFSKFNRRFRNDFFTDQYSDILENQEVVGGMINYFVLRTTTSPVSVSWAKMDDYQCVFSIVFRFKIRENIVILPVPSDSR
jgi:hypothetical protein